MCSKHVFQVNFFLIILQLIDRETYRLKGLVTHTAFAFNHPDTQKYGYKKLDLTNELTKNGYVVNLYAVEVGARGVPAKSLYNLLKDLGLSRAAVSSILERVSKAALVGSYQIWLGRGGNSGSGVCNAERRIRNGINVAGEKRYMAYLTKAPSSLANYDAWLCGGAIVAPTFILTAAACVEDVQHIYAIAGYRKYVKSDMISTDSCTREARKKVTLTCVPKKYDFAYDKIEKWGSIDIAVVQVESPYNFDTAYPLPSCSWVPNKIDINYDPKYQEPGTDAVVFGWGHNMKWRQPNDPIDYNQEPLQYGPILLQPKQKCKRYFNTNPSLLDIIDRYMICAWDSGNLDDEGRLIVKAAPTAEGCSPDVHGQCVDDTHVDDQIQILMRNEYNESDEDAVLRVRGEGPEEADNSDTADSYKNGICQNDHGGPMVTWVGAQEVVIGVASVFRVTSQSDCTGPYLFTSTQCNSAFIDCIINRNGARKQMCDMPAVERGFEIIKRRISWAHHPDGPAEDEKQLDFDLMMRPQIPLHHFANG